MRVHEWKKWLEMRGDTISILSDEHQNSEYGGCIAKINGVVHRVRVAKITAKKVGQFVAVWEKNSEMKNQPFDVSQSPTMLSVFVSDGRQRGVFTFSQSVLQEYGIYTSACGTGKMAFRLYPVWDMPQSKQAIKTQKWQLQYFTLL